MSKLESNELHFNFLFRLTGYGLLLFIALDLVDIIFPAQFMNSDWEFQTLGAVVERLPFSLLGLALVFYEGVRFRGRLELSFLKILSWSSLLSGVLCLLIIPLIISNALRINAANNDQITTRNTQQTAQFRQVKERLDKATNNDLDSLLARFRVQGGSPDIRNPQELKSRLLTEVNKAEKNLNTQSEAERRKQNLGLMKSSLKWSLGALISGILFICIWRATSWARESTVRKGW